VDRASKSPLKTQVPPSGGKTYRGHIVLAGDPSILPVILRLKNAEAEYRLRGSGIEVPGYAFMLLKMGVLFD